MPTVGPETTWGVGDYPLMAERLAGVAAEAVEAVGVRPGDHVLDVACGTGNAALEAAARGAAAVVGVDVEPRLLALARGRPGGADATIRWERGDAEDLPLPDAGFDVVVSVFGVMYAPDHERAARELRRVSVPGARLALTAWTPGGFMPAMGAALGPFLPPPPAGSGPPSRWGDAERLAALLAAADIGMQSAQRGHVELAFDGPSDAVDFLVRTAGHVLAERARLERAGRWGELVAALDALVRERDEGGGGRVLLRLEYLLALARAAQPRL